MRAPSALLALAAAAAVLTACGPVSTTVAAPSTTSAAATPSITATPDPAGQTMASGAEQVAGWWSGGGQAHVNKISADLSQLGSDSSDPTAFGNDCATLSTDISAAQSYQPIPDAQAQQHWSAALDQYQQAATDCQAGISASDATLITKASREITAGTADITEATDRIDQLTAGG